MNEEIASKAEQLVAKGRLKEAVEYLEVRTSNNHEIQKELRLLRSRIQNLRRQERLGVINDIDFRVETNRITYSFLITIDILKGKTRKITTESVLIDRARLIQEEKQLRKAAEKFKSGLSSISRVEKRIEDLFNDFPSRFEDFAKNTGLDLIYLRSDKGSFDSIVNFESKGSVYLKWHRRYSNSLSEAVLVFMLFDRPQTFNNRVPSKEYEPQLIKRIAFEPTINKKMEICWENQTYSFLLTSELYSIIFELILTRLENYGSEFS